MAGLPVAWLSSITPPLLLLDFIGAM